MKKRILAFIISGCMLMQSPGFISWAAETPVYTQTEPVDGTVMSGTEHTAPAPDMSEYGEETDSKTDEPGTGEAVASETDGSETGEAIASETDEPETSEAIDSETDEPETSEATDSETNEPEDGEETDSETDISEDAQESGGEEQEPDLLKDQGDVTDQQDNVAIQQEEAIGEAAYMELGADENSTQNVQYAQSFVESQAAGSGTVKASQGLYFGYTVKDSANHTGILSDYLSESGNIVIPHKLGNYYMVGIGAGVFSGMNRKDSSNTSKLPDQSTSGKTLLSSGEEKILELVNADRIKQGKIPLVMSSTLREAARRKTLDMLNNNYFDHKNPDGSYTYAWLSACGYPWNMWAENIAYNYQSAERLYEQWWNSPGHKANMMNDDLRAIGIGVYKGSDGKVMGTQIFSGTIFQNLTKVEIEYGYETIGANAFSGCTNLKSITIPSTVSQIADNAFSGCGNLTIYGKAGSYAQTFANEKNIPFKVVEEKCPIKKFGYEQTEVFIEKGDMDFINLVMEPVDYKHLIKEEKPEQQVVSFLEDGAVLALEDGSTEIRATAADLETVCKITVGERLVPLQTISFYEDSIELYKGESIKPAYRITPVNATDAQMVTLKSSDSNVFVVNEDSTITAVNAGEARLTVSNEDGSVSAVLDVIVLAVKEDLALPEDLMAVTNVGSTLADVSLEDYPGFSWKEPETKLKAKAGEPVQYFSAQYTAKEGDGATIRQDCILPVKVSAVSGLTAAISAFSELAVEPEGKELTSGRKLSLSESYELRSGVKAVGAEVDSSFYDVTISIDNPEIARIEQTQNGNGNGSNHENDNNADAGWKLVPQKTGKCNVTIEVRLKDKKGGYGPDGKPYGTYKKKYSIQIEDAVYVNELQIELEPEMSTGVQKLTDGSFQVEDGATKFYVRARAFGGSENEMDTALTFGTDKTGVLQVRAVTGEKGLAEVMVKKPGIAVLTVTAKDNGKKTKNVNVYVQNLSPQLPNKTWTLNKLKPAATVFVDLQASEINPIMNVTLYEDKEMQNPSSLFSVQKVSPKDNDAGSTGGSGAVSYTIGFLDQVTEQVTKSSYKLYLKVDTEAKKEYIYPVTVKLKNTQPSVKLLQSAKINLFYKDADAQLKITTGTEKLAAEKAPEQVNIAKNAPHFEVTWEKEGDDWIGTITPVGVTAENYKKINKTVEMRFHFPEYGEDFYITKKLTVKYSYQKAALTTTPAEGLIYQKAGNNQAVFSIVEKTSKNVLIPGEGKESIKVKPDDSMISKAQLMIESGNPDISIHLLGSGSVSAKMIVSHDNWQEPVLCTFKMTVNKKTPSLVLEKTKLSFNTNAAGKEIVSLKASVNKNAAVPIVRLKEGDIVGSNAAAKKLLEEGKISICPQKSGDQRSLVVCLNDSSVRSGTYKYKVYGWCKQGDTKILRMNPVTLSITVSNKQPSASLKAKGKITLSDVDNSGITYTPKLSNITGEIRNAALGGSYASAFTLTDCGDGTYQVKLKENTQLGKGSYKLYFAFILENGVRVTSKAVTIKIG